MIEKIERQTSEITEDPKETTYLYQCLFVTIQRGNSVSFLNTFAMKQAITVM